MRQMRITFSIKADNEIQNIYEYHYHGFGLRVVDEKVNKIYKDIFLLEKDPFMGRSIDGHDQNLRQLSSGPTIIVYDINDSVIEILHIVDGRTDYRNNLLKN